jgi:hypothetical protein
MAEEVVSTLVDLDPSDPLQIRLLIDELRQGGAPIVDLSMSWTKPKENERMTNDE